MKILESLPFSLISDLVFHNLSLFGFPIYKELSRSPVRIFSSVSIDEAVCHAENSGIAIVFVLKGDVSILGKEIQWHHDLGVEMTPAAGQPENCFPLITLNSYSSFDLAENDQSVLHDPAGNSTWLWSSRKSGGGLLYVGTALAADLIQYRQGDPAKAEDRKGARRWDFDVERPNYLYEGHLESIGAKPYDRHADWWVAALVKILSSLSGVSLNPILPGGAIGAIVITGDDDQAYLEKYQEQLSILKGTPITYFLHPKTRHDRKTLKTILGKPNVDLGIHPDALDVPENYAQVYAEQHQWYKSLVGKAPLSVRNHGFLNDGYWGHLDAWLESRTLISSNIPGLDGNIVTSSLIPCRVAMNDCLSDHWSIVTAIGDGVLFVHKMNKAESKQCVLDLGNSIIESGLPGVVVLNLHPQNVTEANGLHEGALELIEKGFIAWSLKDCVSWFATKDCFSMDDGRLNPSSSSSFLMRFINYVTSLRKSFSYL